MLEESRLVLRMILRDKVLGLEVAGEGIHSMILSLRANKDGMMPARASMVIDFIYFCS